MWLRWILFWIVIAGTVIDVGAQTLTPNTLKYGGGDGVGFDRSGIFYTVVAVGPEKACSGDELVFNVEVIGPEYYTYRWKYNGNFLSLGKTLVLKDVREAQTGKYWCEISDPGGKVRVKSREFDLVVSHTPVFELSASKLSLLKGDSTCLKARGDAANTYLWHTGQVADSIWVKPLSSEQYIVTASNGSQCHTTRSISVEVEDLEIEYQRFNYIAKGGETVLKVKSNADSVQWYEMKAAYLRSASARTYLDTGDSIVVSPEETTDYEALFYYNNYQLPRTLTVDVRQSKAFGGGDGDGFDFSPLYFKANISVSSNPVCENAAAVFKATPIGSGNYAYSWRKVGEAGTLSDSSVLVVDPVLPQDSGRYYCVLTESQGKLSVSTDTLYLKVVAKPEVAIVSPLSDTTICSGDVAILRGKAFGDGVNMTWTGQGIIGVPVMDYVEVSPLSYQKYVLTGEREGCFYTDTVGVSVVDSRIDIPSTFHLTNGVQQSVSALSLSGDTLEARQVNWYMNGILSAQKVNPYVFYAKNNVMLTAEYTTTGTACKFRDSAQVFVRNLEPYAGGDNDGFTRTSINFGLTTNIDPNPVCEGETVTFYTTASGIESYTYKWYKVGVSAPLEESCCLTLNAVTLSDSGLYYCEVMAKGVKAMEPDTIRLVVHPHPQISFDHSSKDTTICYGNLLVLKGNSSLPDSKFSWSGDAIEGIAYTDVVKVRPLERTVYSLSVEKDGCVATDTFAVDVNDSRIYLPDVYNATQGEMVVFTAKNGLGDTVPSSGLEWYIGSVLCGEKVNPFSKMITNPETVRAEYSNGYCVFTDSTRVVVKQDYAFHGGDDDGFSRTGINFGVALDITPTPVCQYESVSFTAQTIGIETYKYQWYKVGITDPIKDTCCFTIDSTDLSDAGLYYCAITDKNNKMTVLDTLELVVHERPFPTIDPALRDTVVCYGEKLTLHGTSSAAGAKFIWSGDDLISSPYAESIVVMPHENQKYVLTVEKDGCRQTDTVSVFVNDSRIVLPDVYSATEGEMAMISARSFTGDTVSSANIQWYIGNSQVGDRVNPFSHLVVQREVVKAVYTSGHCVFMDSTLIIVKGNYAFYGGDDDGYSRTALNFGLTVDVDPNPVCEYSPVKFAARTTGIETYNYKWYKVGITDPIKDTCCFTIDSTLLSDAGLYYCEITDKNNKLTLVDTVQLTVHELPFATIWSSVRDTTICFKDSITLTGNSSVPGAVQTWQNTTVGGVVEGQTIRVCPSDSTSYILTVRNYNCETKDTVWVNVNHPYVSIPDIVYVSERGDVILSATNRKGDLIQVDPVEKNIAWTVSGVNKGVVNPLKLRTLTQNELVEVLYTDKGCSIKDTTLIKIKGGYTYAGGFNDGFARSDTTKQEVFLVFSGGGEYCKGDSATVRLQLVGKKSPWNVTIKRGSDDKEATEIVANYPLMVYGQDTVLHFKMSNDERYYVIKVAGDTLSLGAEDTVEVKQIIPPYIDFRTGWPASVGYCHNVNLLDSLRPSIGGLYVDANDIIFYVDSVTLSGGVWDVEDFTQGYHTVHCEVTTDSTCPAVSEEINIRLDSIPVGRISLPEVNCEGVDTVMEIHLYTGPQDYTIDLVQYRYKKGDPLPQIKSRQIELAAVNNGVYQEKLKWNAMGTPDSCQIFEITKITDSHGCITDVSALSPAVRLYDYTDTAWWYQKTRAILQTRYPATAAWKSGEHLFYLPEGDTLEVKVSLMTGTMPWYIINNEVNHYSIQGKDTLFRLGDEGLYRFKTIDSHCGMDEELDSVEIRYPQKGYFRGRLWLEGAYRRSEHLMASSIGGKLLAYYGVTKWPKVEGTVIDMVEIELREANSADIAADTTVLCNVITRDTCLLLSDGRLADRFTGDTLVGLRNGYWGDNSEYYMVVTHRNHLGIMTAAPVKMVNNSEKAKAVMVDFTVQNNVYCKNCAGSSEKLARHMTFVDGRWMMTVGELNKNYLISLFDDNLIGHLLGVNINTTIYDLLYDVNFDGIVDWSLQAGNESDWAIVKKNRGKYSEIITK